MTNELMALEVSGFNDVYDRIAEVIFDRKQDEFIELEISFLNDSIDDLYKNIGTLKKSLSVSGYNIEFLNIRNNNVNLGIAKIANRIGETAKNDLPKPFEHKIKIIKNKSFQINKIIVMKLDHKGDFIMAVNVLVELKKNFPDSDITGVFGSWNKKEAEDIGIFDKVIAFDLFESDGPSKYTDIESALLLAKQLGASKYDLAIDLRVDDDSRHLLLAIDSRLRAGFISHKYGAQIDLEFPLTSATKNNRPSYNKINNKSFTINKGGFLKNDYLCILIGKTRGCVFYGPYIFLGIGAYSIKFDYDIHGYADLNIELASVGNARTYYYGKLKETIDFNVDDDIKDFEIRLSSNGFSFAYLKIRSCIINKEGKHSGPHQSEMMSCLVNVIKLRYGKRI